MNILVTGGAGFIGSNFAKHWMLQYPDDLVSVLDKFTYAGNRENLSDLSQDRLQIVEGDICDSEIVKDAIENIDIVVHLAAESHVDRSIMGAEIAGRTNFMGTLTLLEAAREADLRCFLHMSTDEVYGSIEQGYASEITPFSPCSPYSASKAAADHLAHSYFVTYELPVIIARPGNNYGPYQFPEKLVPLFVYKALRNEPLPVYGDGRQVRDWLHVEDCCQALRVLIENGQPGEAYNVPAGNEHQNLETILLILDELNKPESLIKHVTDRPGHDVRYAMAGDKIAVLGWKPEMDWEQGMRQTVRWFADHQDWMEESFQRGREFHESWYQNRQ